MKDKEVREADIARVIDAAKAVAIPLDREVIHVLPQEFIIDDQDGIKEPLGMAGVRLEAKVHIVTGAVSTAQNIIKCANRCGLNVADIVLEPLASSEAVLDEDEKELGRRLVDIGGGTTDIAIFSDGAIVHTAVIALGGNNLTNDIADRPAHAARTRPSGSSSSYGCALASMVDKDETIEVPSVGGRQPRVLGAADPLRDHRAAGGGDLLAGAAARSRSAATRTCSPRAWSSPAARRCSRACPSWPRRSSACRCAAGMPRGIGGLVDVVKSPHVRDRRRPGACTAPSTRTAGCSAIRDENVYTQGQGPDARVARGDLLRRLRYRRM